ncbi:MAG: WYL domain-containing protein [Trichodesmium sp. MO_231.B1]|nr:WYL domain-containing protein [Trichodesmium sp. MO_231.B1]
MNRKKDTLTLSIPPGTKEQLEAIARRFNIFWGETPSPSGLITAIAQKQLEIGPPFTFNSTQVAAFQQATKTLIDSGYIGEAQTIVSTILERGNLETPLRRSLQQLVNQPSEAWRLQVDEYINQKQPFKLSYQNAQEQNLEFTVRYAEISFEEKRFYLEIWCEETEDIKNTDFPELIHNRCLRLDRIKAIAKTHGQWREEGLDYLKVYLHFYKGMVKAYEPRDRDIENEVVGDVRQVVRQVSNPFWLIREVLKYGGDCVVISPEKLRSRIKQKLLETLDHYT